MFFFSLNVAITGYINSSVMESLGWSNSIIGFIYIASSILALVLLPRITKLTKRIGNRKSMLLFLSGSIVSLLLISFGNQALIQLLSFLFFLVLNFLVIFEMDVFVEHFSTKESTGRIRGIFFTIINLTWALAPLMAGSILEKYSHENIVYILAIVCVVVSFTIFSLHFKKETFKKNDNHSLSEMYKKLILNKDLKNAFFVSTMMHLVYASSMIYIPLHLHLVIGMDWIQIGLLILISNIPYLLLGFPIGYIADNVVGEKKLIITGLIISALGTLGFAFIRYPDFFAWALVFFVSRIGLSIIETSSESYIFKKIEHDDTEMLSMERNAIPLGYLIAPLIGFIISLFTDRYEVIFIIIAILLLMTIYPSLKLKDIQ